MRDKVLAYCERYQVSPGPEGLPPFPSGRRETRQHREWLTVYRARQRLEARAAGSLPAAPPGQPTQAFAVCPVCTRPLQKDLAVLRAHRAAGKTARPVALHPTCAELARLAEAVGPDALVALGAFLWPGPARAKPRLRPPRG